VVCRAPARGFSLPVQLLAAHSPGELIGTAGLQEQEAAAKEEEKKSKRRRTTDESSHHTKAVSGTTRCNFAIARSPARRRRARS
jgi:hypothetical protein